jgi:hypothetical protein
MSENHRYMEGNHPFEAKPSLLLYDMEVYAQRN